jgi:hypothetical protein
VAGGFCWLSSVWVGSSLGWQAVVLVQLVLVMEMVGLTCALFFFLLIVLWFCCPASPFLSQDVTALATVGTRTVIATVVVAQEAEITTVVPVSCSFASLFLLLSEFSLDSIWLAFTS